MNKEEKVEYHRKWRKAHAGYYRKKSRENYNKYYASLKKESVSSCLFDRRIVTATIIPTKPYKND